MGLMLATASATGVGVAPPASTSFSAPVRAGAEAPPRHAAAPAAFKKVELVVGAREGKERPADDEEDRDDGLNDREHNRVGKQPDDSVDRMPRYAQVVWAACGG